jgi:hypothetical protein
VFLYLVICWYIRQFEGQRIGFYFRYEQTVFFSFTGCRALPSIGFWGLQGSASLDTRGSGALHLCIPGALEHCICGYRGLWSTASVETGGSGALHLWISGARALLFCGFWWLQGTAILWLTVVLEHCHSLITGGSGDLPSSVIPTRLLGG